MANKPLKTLTLPSLKGSVTYDLHPDWDNIENKPDIVGEAYKINDVIKGELFNDYENNVASGAMSHAEGSNTIASSDNQHVQGRYNIEDAENTYAHIVGNGSETTRSNAHTLDWSGNAWYAGTMTAQAVIIGSMSYGDTLPKTGVEGQLFFLIGGNEDDDNEAEVVENDGIITLSNLTAIENDGIITLSDLFGNKVTVTENDGIVIIAQQTDDDVEAIENNGIVTFFNSEVAENNGVITISNSASSDIKATESDSIVTITV